MVGYAVPVHGDVEVLEVGAVLGVEEGAKALVGDASGMQIQPLYPLHPLRLRQPHQPPLPHITIPIHHQLLHPRHNLRPRQHPHPLIRYIIIRQIQRFQIMHIYTLTQMRYSLIRDETEVFGQVDHCEVEWVADCP